MWITGDVFCRRYLDSYYGTSRVRRAERGGCLSEGSCVCGRASSGHADDRADHSLNLMEKVSIGPRGLLIASSHRAKQTSQVNTTERLLCCYASGKQSKTSWKKWSGDSWKPTPRQNSSNCINVVIFPPDSLNPPLYFIRWRRVKRKSANSTAFFLKNRTPGKRNGVDGSIDYCLVAALKVLPARVCPRGNVFDGGKTDSPGEKNKAPRKENKTQLCGRVDSRAVTWLPRDAGAPSRERKTKEAVSIIL